MSELLINDIKSNNSELKSYNEGMQIIEEMAEVLKNYTERNYIMASHVILECYAEELYSKNYRKQEWISVDERLPEDTQMCLAYATVYFVPDHVDDCDHCERIIVTKYYKEFGFMDWDVHYWMPLPEAPKMKGDSDK